MLIKHLGLLCIVSITAVSYAKDTDSCFDLRKYVPPEFNYHLLELKPDISLNGENQDYHNSSYEKVNSGNVQIDDFRSYNNTRPSMGLEARHKYYGWRGRTEWQIGDELSCYGSVSHRDPYSSNYISYQNYSTNNERFGTISGKADIIAAYYFKWPFFWGGGITPSFSGNMSHYKEIAKSAEKIFDAATNDIISKEYRFRDNKTIRKNYFAGISANCRVGAGHINDISFAIAALNIVDRIAESEKTYSGCSSKRIQDLASLIEKVRKRRAFDSRIARMENIDTLCKLITDIGITADLTPRTVLEIADQWDYVFYQTRKSGFVVELCPTVNYQKSSINDNALSSYAFNNDLPSSYELSYNTTNEFHENSSTLEYDHFTHTDRVDYSTILKAKYELPITRYFQCGFDAKIAPSIVQTWNSDKTWEKDTHAHTTGVYPALSAEETARFGYFPNTRTSITISESIKYDRKFDYVNLDGSGYEISDVPAKTDLDIRELQANVQLNASYYVSPQLQVHINAGISWSDSYQKSYGQLPRLNEKLLLYSDKEFRYQLGGNVVWGIF